MGGDGCMMKFYCQSYLYHLVVWLENNWSRVEASSITYIRLNDLHRGLKDIRVWPQMIVWHSLQAEQLKQSRFAAWGSFELVELRPKNAVIIYIVSIDLGSTTSLNVDLLASVLMFPLPTIKKQHVQQSELNWTELKWNDFKPDFSVYRNLVSRRISYLMSPSIWSVKSFHLLMIKGSVSKT